MTETTFAEPIGPASVATGQSIDVLTTLIIGLLVPMFLGPSAGDIGIARRAAIETVNAYRGQDQAGLLATAQIIAFGLAGLSSLTLSMASDLSLSMTLRLRGNAIALNRSAQQNRRTLDNIPPDPQERKSSVAEAEPETQTIQTGEAEDNAALATSVAALQIVAKAARSRLQNKNAAVGSISAMTTGHPITPPVAGPVASAAATGNLHRMTWADAAGKLTASLAALPPIQRQAASMRAAALASTATQLLSGANTIRLIPLSSPTPLCTRRDSRTVFATQVKPRLTNNRQPR